MKDLDKNSVREFNSWAKTYDNPFNHFFFTHSNQAVVKLLSLTEAVSILDVGAGTGILIELVLLKSKMVRLFGVDISPEMVKRARKKFQGNNNVIIGLGSASKLPYKDNFFDFVTCSNSFHHYSNSFQSLKEMKRVLKPGGKVILLDGCLNGVFRQIIFKVENSINKEGKVYRYTREQMKNLFNQAGFMNISQQYSFYLGLITAGEK